MNKEKQGFSAFLLHFLERLNSDKTIEAKITESLTDICKYYGFKNCRFCKPPCRVRQQFFLSYRE